VVGKRTSARRRKRSGKPTRRRLAQHWPAALALGLAGIAALVISFAVLGGEGGQSQSAPTPMTESSGGSQATPLRTGGPSIQFSASSIDLGQVPLDTPVSDTFEFLNAGDETLRIEGVDVKMLEGC
jgi:hypothetical protein